MIKKFSPISKAPPLQSSFSGEFEEGEAPFFEDAWVDLHNIFDLPLSITIGQFQIADLMFLRETRLTDADFYIFKLNPYPLTYHRGMNGIGPAEGIFFDNNTQKWYFGRVYFWV